MDARKSWGRAMGAVGLAAGYAAALVGYVLFMLPARGVVRAVDIAVFAAAGIVPVAVNLLHGDGLRESGLRVDNARAAARAAWPVTTAMIAGTVVIGVLSGGFHWVSTKTFFEKAGLYLVWGPVQQYLLNSFALRRMVCAGVPAAWATVLAAGFFSLVHLPNWPLVAITFAGGLVWCRLFLREPNVLVLGLCHGVLAVLVYHAWPEGWLERLTIGRMYLERVGGW